MDGLFQLKSFQGCACLNGRELYLRHLIYLQEQQFADIFPVWFGPFSTVLLSHLFPTLYLCFCHFSLLNFIFISENFCNLSKSFWILIWPCRIICILSWAWFQVLTVYMNSILPSKSLNKNKGVWRKCHRLHWPYIPVATSILIQQSPSQARRKASFGLRTLNHVSV